MKNKQGSTLKKNNFVKLIVIPAILLLGGCNKDLKKVAKFGETSAQLKTATSSMAEDIYREHLTNAASKNTQAIAWLR